MIEVFRPSQLKGAIKVSLLKEYGIKEDSRFKRARKEALRIVFLVVVQTIWVFGFAYWGTKTDPEEYTFTLGMPTWYFWAFLGAGVITPVIALILGLMTEDCELTDDIPQEEDHAEENLPN